MSDFAHLDFRSPIFLLGMPRSGTTWLSQIFESSPECLVRLSPNYSFPLKNRLTKDSCLEQWQEVLRLAAVSTDEFLTQNWRRETGELTYFPDALTRDPLRMAIKDTRYHDVYLSGMELMPQAKAIIIVRHPAAALWSWRSCKEFPRCANFTQEWRTGLCKKSGVGEYWGFDDWKKLTNLYVQLEMEYPERYKIIRYENLVNNIQNEVADLFSFSGLHLSRQTILFLQESQSRHDSRPYSVYKTKQVSNAWKENFPKHIFSEISNELVGSVLERFIL
ncbi:sulfotransferase [Desulfovibrio sulfodismutans]|uniref:Sulfotransferase n=1 Tax=Desulfolutivibrio sulfodismutans TaxID=63561 RepID=A0A7K3NRX6_9BACT|nr:sulfotransferase [Desulfolutivibrio sulfodismutans]NDY57959.1 sulfotransferase [Desulfolutivibrio sulfodismutans]QLA14629.1 hypothetical protein GD606_19985 [Desulfolutivibrio sulfodismutans DSM 3696]